MWKMDLKGAYTLLSFHPDSVHLFGMGLSNDIIIFFPSWRFWLDRDPFNISGFDRSILFELRPLISGLYSMYMDDIMGVCWDVSLFNN